MTGGLWPGAAQRLPAALSGGRRPLRETPLSAKAGWTKTSVEVKNGEVVHLETTGKWTVSPKYEPFDADGIAHKGFLDYRVYKGGNLGAVICRVGGSDKVYAGKSQRFMADRDGPIECRINDDETSNNVGEVTVERMTDTAAK